MFLPPHSYPYPRILLCSHPHRGGHRLVHSVPVPLCDLPPSSQETCWDHVHLRAVSWTQHFYSGCNMHTCLMLWENVCSSIAESGVPYLYIVHCIWLPMNCRICTSCEEFHNENLLYITFIISTDTVLYLDAAWFQSVCARHLVEIESSMRRKLAKRQRRRRVRHNPLGREA